MEMQFIRKSIRENIQKLQMVQLFIYIPFIPDEGNEIKFRKVSVQCIEKTFAWSF